MAQDSINFHILPDVLASLDDAKFDGTERFDNIEKFIEKCNLAMSQCNEKPTKTFIFTVIKSKLDGEAQSAVAKEILQDWPTLKRFLQSKYSKKFNFTLSLKCLLEHKQNDRNLEIYITEFREKFNNLIRNINGKLSPKDRQIQTTFLNQMALQVFIKNLDTNLGTFVKYKTPTSLENAISIATVEHQPKNDNTPTFMTYKGDFFGICGFYFGFFQSPQFHNTVTLSIATGSKVCIIKRSILRRNTKIYTDTDGTDYCKADIILPNQSRINHRFDIHDNLPIKDDGLMGCDFLALVNFRLDCKSGELRFSSDVLVKLYRRDQELTLENIV